MLNEFEVRNTKLLDYFHRRHLRILSDPKLISLATVSGVLSTKPAMVLHCDTQLPEIEVITTKSFQVTMNPGNREPILCEMASGSFGNSVGLRNPGMEVAHKDLENLRKSHTFSAYINVSVSASSVEDFITLIEGFKDVADIIELNFSCPHASEGFGSSIGCSLDISSMYMKKIREAVGVHVPLIFPKLTPNVDNIGEIAKALIDQGADGLSLINTVGPEIHISPVSHTPILQNSLGGKGGKSGKWVFDRALECVKEVRLAIGDDIPLIGMGGVSTGEQLAQMIIGGADVVGIGSAFGKVHQKNWPLFTKSIVEDAREYLVSKQDPSSVSAVVIDQMNMEYKRHTIVDKNEIGNDTVIVTLSGKLDYHGGEFVFLWLPSIGEKPFSVAKSDPLTFIIKRRGAVSAALCDLAIGDDVYLRGLYGAPVVIDPLNQSILVAGGTGIAVLPPVAKELHEIGVSRIDTFVGISDHMISGRENSVQQELEQYSNVHVIEDNSVVARVLQHITSVITDGKNCSSYIVGPKIFMRKAAEVLLDAGVKKEHIYLSLELQTMCGIGMCGECACNDRLTCQYGTFVSYDYLLSKAPDLL
jgi:dihydroorotate dehydrogenase (NAD+) catalytic subunit